LCVCKSPDSTPARTASRSAVFSQTSLMCIAASVGFVLCVTPSIVLTMGRNRWKTAGGYTQAAYFVSRAVAHQLACVNHAVNFFLYCVTGQRFRGELLGLLRRQRSSVSSFDASTRRYYQVCVVNSVSYSQRNEKLVLAYGLV